MAKISPKIFIVNVGVNLRNNTALEGILENDITREEFSTSGTKGVKEQHRTNDLPRQRAQPRNEEQDN